LGLNADNSSLHDEIWTDDSCRSKECRSIARENRAQPVCPRPLNTSASSLPSNGWNATQIFCDNLEALTYLSTNSHTGFVSVSTARNYPLGASPTSLRYLIS
jgi:hypothetical protein